MGRLTTSGRPILVTHNAVPDGAAADEADVLDQVMAVTGALNKLRRSYDLVAIDGDLTPLGTWASSHPTGIVFNLIEAVGGDTARAREVPHLLAAVAVPFTGNNATAMVLTDDKIAAKTRLVQAGVSTPGWIDPRDESADVSLTKGPFIVKAVDQHASLGLSAGSVCGTLDEARRQLDRCRAAYGGTWFIEQFIQGREFNIAVLEGRHGPQVLPVAEIDFSAFPAERPQIVDYEAKWQAGSFAYSNTPRRFLQAGNSRLAVTLAKLALQCWQEFGLSGYGRIDVRVDSAGKAWVLEANANPCLSPDAGFVAAAAYCGLNMSDVVTRLLDCAVERHPHRAGQRRAA